MSCFFYWHAALKQKISAVWAKEPNCFVFLYFFLATVWLKLSESSSYRKKQEGSQVSVATKIWKALETSSKNSSTLEGKRKRQHERVRVTEGFLQLWQTRGGSVFQILTMLWWLELCKLNPRLSTLWNYFRRMLHDPIQQSRGLKFVAANHEYVVTTPSWWFCLGLTTTQVGVRERSCFGFKYFQV